MGACASRVRPSRDDVIRRRRECSRWLQIVICFALSQFRLGAWNNSVRLGVEKSRSPRKWAPIKSQERPTQHCRAGLGEVTVEDSDTIGRRDFALKSVLAVLAGTTITVTGCGSDDSPTAPTNGSDPGGGSATGAISANHSHAAQITGAQLTAGDAISLEIQGSATHPHTVELTMNDVQQIVAGNRVSTESSFSDSSAFGNHRHTVSFN